MRIVNLLLAFILGSGFLFLSCKKEIKYYYQPPDSARISITNASPAISDLLFYVNNKSFSLPDSPLSFGNTTFVNGVDFSNGINPGTVEIPYFKIMNGYQEISFASVSPSSYVTLANNFQPGGYYSVFITDTVNSGHPKVVIIQDFFDHVRDTTKALMRFLNLSPDAPPMDLWAFPNGGYTGYKIFSNCAYILNDDSSVLNARNFTMLDAGLYYFEATQAGTTNILLEGGVDITPQNAITLFTKGFLYGSGANAINVGAIFFEP